MFTREAHLISTDLSLHVGRGMVVNSSAAAMDHYLAFDAAAERLAKQLRRYKRRLRDYHGGKTRPPAERQERRRLSFSPRLRRMKMTRRRRRTATPR